jgi:hypothetical protein
MCKQGQRRHSNKIYSNTKQNYNNIQILNLKQSTSHFNHFSLFANSLSQNFSNIYSSTTKKLDFNSIPNKLFDRKT